MVLKDGSGSQENRAARINRGSWASIRDVAARAHVSVATVSNVLNRPDRVAPETRSRVRLAMEELDFVPDESARQLRRGQSRAIGVVVLDIVNPFWGEVVRGVESVAAESGFILMLGSSDESASKEARFLSMLDERRPHGLLIASVREEESYLKRIHDRGTPVVLLDRGSDTGMFSSVAVDDVRGGELAAHHLFECGHRRIGFVNGPLMIRWCADRRRGVYQAARERGVDPARAILEIPTSSLTAREGEAIVEKVLKAEPRPTALLCANDLLALGILRKLAAVGIAVPDEIALVGYDDVPFAAVLSPSLTSIRQPAYEVGRTAVELLINEISVSRPSQPRHILFQPELVIRRSSAAHGDSWLSPMR